MKHLKRGLEDLTKFKNRVAKLYGMNRLSAQNFNRLNNKIINLHEFTEEVIIDEKSSSKKT